VAGVAVSQSCEGDGPYNVTGKLSFVSDSSAFAPGARVYVDALNAGIASASSNHLTSGLPASGPVKSGLNRLRDMRLYYYGAAQNIGCGALGIGYEQSVGVSRSLSLAVDGGVAATGSIDTLNSGNVKVDQLIKSLNGQVRLDFVPWFGFYSCYRWSEGRGEDHCWKQVKSDLRGKPFAAPSNCDTGTVQMQGIEYGLTLRPLRWLALSAGYIPACRADYGSLGVRSQPGYTAELRVGGSGVAARARGAYSDGYWLGDLSITIR
jgi:hypothetical protein